MSLAYRMAKFVFSLQYEDLPMHVIRAAQRQLADTLACALGSYSTEPIQILRQHASLQGGSADSTMIGSGTKVPADMASLINGTMVRYLDANDITALTFPGAGHFSDATPALLAVAEKHQRPGRELLTCLVASYELQGALAQSFDFMERGFHALTEVSWVAPLVAVRLMGGTPEQAIHACGLSGATGMILNTWLKPSQSIPMIKGVSVGMAGQRAIESAELAVLGITASDDALETGFEILGPLSDSEADTEYFDRLGVEWTTPRSITKAYPAQIYTQAAIEATLEIFRRGVRANDVRELTLYGHRNVAAGVQGSPAAYEPTSREAADHSTPFVMAMALLRGRMTLQEYEVID